MENWQPTGYVRTYVKTLNGLEWVCTIRQSNGLWSWTAGELGGPGWESVESCANNATHVLGVHGWQPKDWPPEKG